MKYNIILVVTLISAPFFSQHKQNDYQFDNNRVKLDKTLYNNLVKLSGKNNDFDIYRGVELTYDRSNNLHCKVDMSREYGPEADLSQIATSRWKTTTCYNKNGLAVLKFQTFLGSSKYYENLYYRAEDGLIVKSENIGDVLFSSTTQDIIKVLEEININPLSIYEKYRYSEQNSHLDKILTPTGEYWEFYINQINVYVLIDDKTRKILAKTYDTSPKASSQLLAEQYFFKKRSLLYPETIKPLHNEEEVWNIVHEISPNAIKLNIGLLTKDIWRIKINENRNPKTILYK